MNTQAIDAFRRAQEHHSRGKLDLAIQAYRDVLKRQPLHHDSAYFLAVALYQSGNVAESLRYLDLAIRINPASLAALKDRALILMKAGQNESALASFDHAIRLRPDLPDLHVNRGIVLKNLGRTVEAIASHRQAIALNPGMPEAHNNLGLAQLIQGDREAAVESLKTSLALKPEYGEAAYNLAKCYLELELYDEAIRGFRAALAIRPDDIDAWTSLSECYRGRQLHKDAMDVISEALAIHPRAPKLILVYGTLLVEVGNFDEAIGVFDRALAADPDNSDALLHKAGTLMTLGREDEALACYERVIALKPEQPEAHCLRGSLLKKRWQISEAIKSYDRAILLKPDYFDAFLNRGNAYGDCSLFGKATEDYSRAIDLDPKSANAYRYRATALSKTGRPDLALIDFEKAMSLGSNPDQIHALQFAEKLSICAWTGFERDVEHLTNRILEGSSVCSPFTSLLMTDSSELQLRCAQNSVRGQKQWPKHRSHPGTASHPSGKISVGYFSADFHDHPMLFLMAEVFERHDRERFRIVGFSFGPRKKSAALDRVLPYFDAFHDTREMSDDEIRRLAQKEGIDIAVDRKGYTENSRTSLFAAGLAPVQVNYLAYPGTMGAPFIDYLVADPVLVPESSQHHYTEKIAYLPHSYQPNDRKRVISENTPSRADLGLPDGAFVYCCFNNNRKIMPDQFVRWMRILQKAPGSVLWLMQDNDFVPVNLRAEATRHGIDPDRIIFAKRMPLPDHLARHRQADLFLDSLPYNAHTTTSDALWAGLPVLTLMGQTFTARVAASLLIAAGLPEFVAETPEEYERLALHFYEHRPALFALKAKLAAQRLTCPLFDSERYVRDLENLYIRMVERYRAGLAPDHIRL